MNPVANPTRRAQIISIDAAGCMSGLQVKRGAGLDLRQFGRAQIERVSLVTWDESEQAWYVDILKAPEEFRGVLTTSNWFRAGVCQAGRGSTVRGDGALLFAEYEDGVAAEIAYLDALRVRGLLT